MGTSVSPCVGDAEHLKATIDATTMPVKLVMRPKEFGRLLSHFQTGQNDITILCLPEDEGADLGGAGGGGGGRGLHSSTLQLNLSRF